jgi:hypothetical protein
MAIPRIRDNLQVSECLAIFVADSLSSIPRLRVVLPLIDFGVLDRDQLQRRLPRSFR